MRKSSKGEAYLIIEPKNRKYSLLLRKEGQVIVTKKETNIRELNPNYYNECIYKEKRKKDSIWETHVPLRNIDENNKEFG